MSDIQDMQKKGTQNCGDDCGNFGQCEILAHLFKGKDSVLPTSLLVELFEHCDMRLESCCRPMPTCKNNCSLFPCFVIDDVFGGLKKDSEKLYAVCNQKIEVNNAPGN